MNIDENKLVTYNTKYGIVTLYKNDIYINSPFKNGEYLDVNTVELLKKYIDKNKNIIEIGGHCGTSTILYSKLINNPSKIHVFEPQKNMYQILNRNIIQNNIEDKVITYNKGIFCYSGKAIMNNIDLDGGDYGNIQKRYNDESDLNCNFGGVGLGKDGEEIDVITLDSLDIENIGYIHCDAQGSENFIFSKGINIISKNRPVILYENKDFYGTYLYDNICNTYPQYREYKNFDIKDFCMNTLGYRKYIDRFNNSIDTLLIP